MAIIQKSTAGAAYSLFDLNNQDMPPSGTFEATIIDVRDKMGVERTKFQSQETEVVDLTAFLFGYRGADGKPYRIDTRPMKISGHPKSALVQFVTGLLGRTPEVGYDTMRLKGTKCLLTVAHVTGESGTPYATIMSATPLPQGWGQKQQQPPEIQIADDEADDEIPF